MTLSKQTNQQNHSVQITLMSEIKVELQKLFASKILGNENIKRDKTIL